MTALGYSRQARIGSRLFGFSVLVLILAVIAIFVAFAGAPASAGDDKPCVGTYLMEYATGGGTGHALWTFSDGGTFQATDSGEDYLQFSHQQGAWKATGKAIATLTHLDFHVDGVESTTEMARIDGTVTFGNRCASIIDSDLELRLYNVAEGGDPLNINSPSEGPWDLGLYTGRLVTAGG